MIGPAAALTAVSLLFAVPSTDATSGFVGCKEENAFLNNPGVLEITKSLSSGDCFRLCTKNPLCSSVNYNDVDRSCVLGSRAVLTGGSGVHLVAAPGFTHVSLYSCSPEVFWSQCDFSDCGKHPLFRKHGNMCFFMYLIYQRDITRMATKCGEIGGDPAKIRSQAAADDMRAWMGEVKGLGFGVNSAFLGARRQSGSCAGFFWMVDGSPIKLWNPHSPSCFNSLSVHETNFFAQFASNPRAMICERLC